MVLGDCGWWGVVVAHEEKTQKVFVYFRWLECNNNDSTKCPNHRHKCTFSPEIHRKARIIVRFVVQCGIPCVDLQVVNKQESNLKIINKV